MNLARIDEADNQPERARQRYLDILKAAPVHLDAMLELARLEEANGRPAEALRWLDKARSTHNKDIRTHLVLSAFYLRQGQARQALDAAKDAQAQAPDNPDTLLALAQSQIAVRQRRRRAWHFAPSGAGGGVSPGRLTQAAALQVQVGDAESARYTLSKALLDGPAYIPALVQRVRLELQSGNVGEAEKQAQALRTMPTLSYLNEDGNADHRTVMQVRTSKPIAPGATGRFRIEWESLLPHGSVGRAGWVHDYHFVAQWFPKIGVFWKGQWNCHPFYPWTEFFADFGVYDVRLTLPRGFVVGATGRLEEQKDNPDGTEALRFVQEDVHDLAWTASRRFLERRARFEDPGYPPVDVRLLRQPEHAHL